MSRAVPSKKAPAIALPTSLVPLQSVAAGMRTCTSTGSPHTCRRREGLHPPLEDCAGRTRTMPQHYPLCPLLQTFCHRTALCGSCHGAVSSLGRGALRHPTSRCHHTNTLLELQRAALCGRQHLPPGEPGARRGGGLPNPSGRARLWWSGRVSRLAPGAGTCACPYRGGDSRSTIPLVLVFMRGQARWALPASCLRGGGPAAGWGGAQVW